MLHLRRERFLILAALIAVTFTGAAHAGFAQFVTRSGSTLYVGSTPFRFAGFNLSAPDANNWSPDGIADRRVLSEYQIDDAMATANEMGVTVVRVWAATNSLGSVQGQAQFSTNTDTVNATSLQQETDYLLQSAANHNVRIIFTLLEGYYDCLGHLTGGKDTISDWTFLTCSNFFTDSAQISAFVGSLRYATPVRTLVCVSTPERRSWLTGTPIALTWVISPYATAGIFPLEVTLWS